MAKTKQNKQKSKSPPTKVFLKNNIYHRNTVFPYSNFFTLSEVSGYISCGDVSFPLLLRTVKLIVHILKKMPARNQNRIDEGFQKTKKFLLQTPIAKVKRI